MVYLRKTSSRNDEDRSAFVSSARLVIAHEIPMANVNIFASVYHVCIHDKCIDMRLCRFAPTFF